MSHRILESRGILKTSGEALAKMIASPGEMTLADFAEAHATIHAMWNEMAESGRIRWSGREWTGDDILDLHLELLANTESLGVQHLECDTLDSSLAMVLEALERGEDIAGMSAEKLRLSPEAFSRAVEADYLYHLGEKIERDEAEGYWQLEGRGGLKSLGRERPADMESEPMDCMALVIEKGGRRRVRQIRSHERSEGTRRARELAEKEGGKVTLAKVVGRKDGKLVWKNLFTLHKEGQDLMATFLAHEEGFPQSAEDIAKDLAAEPFDALAVDFEKKMEQGPDLAHEEVCEKCGVFIRLPEDLASQFPPQRGEDDSPPHQTLLFIGDVPREDIPRLARIVEQVTAKHAPFEVEVTDYGEFENPEGKVIPHMIPRALGDPDPSFALHKELREQVMAHGFRVNHHPGPMKNHITLGYLEPGETYTGPRPRGRFTVDAVELWAGKEAIPCTLGGLPLREDMDLARMDRDAEQSAEQDAIIFGRFFRPASFQTPIVEGQPSSLRGFMGELGRRDMPVLASVMPRGARALAFISKEGVRLFRADGSDITESVHPLVLLGLEGWRFENGVTTAVLDVMLTAHSEDGSLAPAAEALRRLDEEETSSLPMVANVLDLLLLDDCDCHHLPAYERWLKLSAMRWCQAGELPNPFEGSVNVIPVEKVQTKGSLPRVLARMRATRGSRGALVRSAGARYPLDGAPVGRLLPAAAVLRARITERAVAEGGKEFVYRVALEGDGVLREDVGERLTMKADVRSRRRFKPGVDVGLEVTGGRVIFEGSSVIGLELEGPRIVELKRGQKRPSLMEALSSMQSAQILEEVEGDEHRLVYGEGVEEPMGFTERDGPVEVVWSKRLDLLTAALDPAKKARLMAALVPPQVTVTPAGIHSHFGGVLSRSAHLHAFLVERDMRLPQGVLLGGTLLFTNEGGEHNHGLGEERETEAGEHAHGIHVLGADFQTDMDGGHSHESETDGDSAHRHRLEIETKEGMVVLESLMPEDLDICPADILCAGTRLTAAMKPRPRSFVVQARFYGRRGHHDLRMEREDGLCDGFTLFDCGELEFPVASLAAARHAMESHPGGVHWLIGQPNQPTVPAAVKAVHSPEWMDREGVETSGAVVLRVDDGEVFEGFRSDDRREFFFAGRKLKGRVLFERGAQGSWEMRIPDEQTPHVLSRAAVEAGSVTAFGEPALPDELAEAIPGRLRFWEAFDEGKRREVRDELFSLLEQSGAGEAISQQPFMNLVPQDIHAMLERVARAAMTGEPKKQGV